MAMTTGPVQPLNPKPQDIWIDTSLAGSRFPAHPGRTSVVFDAGAGLALQEPNLFINPVDGLLYCFVNYSGNGRLYRAADPRGPWTALGLVLGGGVGGEALGCIHPSVYVEGNNVYVFYITSGSATTVKVAQATMAALAATPTAAFGGQATVYSKAGGTVPGLAQFGNFSVVKLPSGVYRLYIEATGTNSDSWQTMAAECATINGTYVMRTGVLTSLIPQPVFEQGPGEVPVSASNFTVAQYQGMGQTGPIFWENGQYVQIYHAGPDLALPTDLYRATSPDGLTWTIDLWGYAAYDRSDSRWELDQVADPYPVNFNGVWWCFWTAAVNAGTNNGRWVVKAAPLSPTMRMWDGGGWVPLDQDAPPKRWRGFFTRTRTVDSPTPVRPFDIDLCDPSGTANFARVLPPAGPGVRVMAANMSTTTGTLAYSADTNDTIVGGGPVIVAPGEVVWFECARANQWLVLGRRNRGKGAQQAVASSATPALNCALGNIVTFTATAASAWGAPTNVPAAGERVVVAITQDATGGWAITWNAAYIFPTAFSNTGNTAGKKTLVEFISDGTALVAQSANAWY